MLSATLTFAQIHDCDITEQYVDWGNNINIIFMRDQNSPPLMTNMLKWGNNINFIFMRVQNSPPPQNNMLIGKKKQLYLHEGSTFATPSEQYVDWDNNTNFIFMRDQNSPSPMALWPMLNGVITSTFSSWGIKIRKAGHQLRANVQVAAKMFQHSHFSDIGFGSHGGTTKLDQIRPYVVLKAFERHGFG